MDVKTERESEKTINLSESLSVIMSKAKSMAVSSAEKIDELSGRRFL